MKKLLTLSLAICLVFTMTVAATAEVSQTQENAIFHVLSATKVQVATDDTNVTNVTVQLPLHKMIEAGIFNAETTQTFIDIIKNTWNEVTTIPAIDQPAESKQDDDRQSTPSAIHITHQVNEVGDTISIQGFGILPAGEPAIKEEYTFLELVKEKIEDAVMLKLSEMVLSKKEAETESLKKQADDALLQVINGFETDDLSLLRTKIQNYVNASNLYKVAKIEFEKLDQYHKDTVVKTYKTEYTIIDNELPDQDNDCKDFNREKYIQNKLQIIEKLLKKECNDGTENAASKILRNMERKFQEGKNNNGKNSINNGKGNR